MYYFTMNGLIQKTIDMKCSCFLCRDVGSTDSQYQHTVATSNIIEPKTFPWKQEQMILHNISNNAK